MGFSSSLLDLSSQYLLCKWSYLLLKYRIASREMMWKRSWNTESLQIFFTMMQRKTDAFKKYLWKKQKLFPSPSLVQMHRHPEFTENQTGKRFEGSTPTPEKKPLAGYCKVKECDLLTPAPLVSHPFISMSAPSPVSFHCPRQLKNTSPTKGWTALLQNASLLANWHFLTTVSAHIPLGSTPW